jgi:acyl carrier protein
MNALEIRLWLIDFVATLLEVEPRLVDAEMPFDRLGVDSATTLVLAADLGSWLGIELSPVEVFDYPTIEALTAQLSALSPVKV